MMTMEFIHDLIAMACKEDIDAGDITTSAIVSPQAAGQAVIRSKESIIVCGLEVARAVFARVDSELLWRPCCRDGDRGEPGSPLAIVQGRLGSILTAERIALNFLQHLSGVATTTRQFVEAISGTNAKILDTRKTLPGYRALQKYAVRIGGGENHRCGLFDRSLIKHNHIAAAGGMREAIDRVNRKRTQGILLEVEARTLDDVIIACNASVDIILLDNMTPDLVASAVDLVNQRVKLEVSGNITLANAVAYARTGVDSISVGCITHSAKAADIHMVVA